MSQKASIVSALIIGALLCGVSFILMRQVNPVIRDPLSSDSLKQIMQGIYDADHSVVVPDHDISGLIVPHHLTASKTIASGIRMLIKRKPKTVLLISPDHFNKCPTVICTTHGTFTTLLGPVKTDDVSIDFLSRSSLVTLDHTLFDGEHGIGAVTPFIKRYLPDTTIVPVVLSQKIGWYERRETILKALQGIYDRTDSIIVSSDFSHYLPLTQADQMDEDTAEVLFAGDLQGIAQLKNPDQSDCPNCLWAFANIAKNNDFYNPSVILHTNSSRILHDESVKETTSHFAIAWYKNDDLTGDDPAVAGDVTMTRTDKTPQLHPVMKRFWSGKGLRFVNLEGPLATTCIKDPNNIFTFCNLENIWQGLLGLATHWGIMNNHMLDQHREGIEQTKRIIADNHETWVGDSMITAGNVHLIALTALMNPVIDAPTLDLSASYDQVINQLKKKSETGTLTVVLVHEGKEYRALTSDKENAYLRSFIDAGADVVVAAHTHVLSDMEIYKGKPIFHGLGNFIFDQFDKASTSTSMAVRLRKENGRIMFETLRTRE